MDKNLAQIWLDHSDREIYASLNALCHIFLFWQHQYIINFGVGNILSFSLKV